VYARPAFQHRHKKYQIQKHLQKLQKQKEYLRIKKGTYTGRAFSVKKAFTQHLTNCLQQLTVPFIEIKERRGCKKRYICFLKNNIQVLLLLYLR